MNILRIPIDGDGVPCFLLVKSWDAADRLIMVLGWLGPRWEVGYDDWVGDPDAGYQHNS